jgi:hypothetical protein
MKKMLDATARYAPDQKPESLFVQGWIQAEIIAEILKRADRANDLTRSGVIKALESMRDVDLGGLSAPLSFGPEHLGQRPTRQTRMFEVSVEERFPDMLKPFTPFSAGPTADAPFESTTTSESAR